MVRCVVVVVCVVFTYGYVVCGMCSMCVVLLHVCGIRSMRVVVLHVCTHVPWSVWRSENSFLELVLLPCEF